MVRVLHTSDWHLGATTKQVSREADHRQFLDWLHATIVERGVDVLVVAGDVFDQAQPSAEAQRLYYGFLGGLAGTGVRKVVVVGGNHDSASRLEAPADLLALCSVHVVGGLLSSEEDRERCLCPVEIDGRPALVVLAVPFVHEYRLGLTSVTEPEEELRRKFHAALTALYRGLTDRAVALAGGAPVIATGHLVAFGHQPGDTPSDIHMVGTLGAVPPAVFDERLAHVALGHLHRMFRVGASRAWYSGTPIQLSAHEAGRPRHVLQVDLAPGEEAVVTPIEVPQRREMVEVRGRIDAVLHRLERLAWQTEAPPLVSVVVEAEQSDGGLYDRLICALDRGGEPLSPVLVELREEAPRPAAGDPVSSLPSLGELGPEEVFGLLCGRRGVALDDELLVAFRSVLEEPVEEEGAR